MARCYYGGPCIGAGEHWGSLVVKTNITDSMVQFCRHAFEGRWKRFWIEPVYFDDLYFKHTDRFFREVGVNLYRQLSDRPKRQAGLSVEKYRELIWQTAINDIAKQRGEVVPLHVIVQGTRHSDDSERIVSVRVVQKLPEWDD